MALVGINLKPSRRELQWFGLIVLAVFALVGALVLWRGRSPGGAAVVWFAGLLLTLVYYAIRPLRRPIYLGWMHAVFPIGWVLSHLLLGMIYYLVLTPIGLAVRVFGGDPMRRRLDPAARSYWIPRTPAGSPERYFRQF